MIQETTKQILVKIADLLRSRADVLNALADKLNMQPLSLHNSLEKAISEATIKDVTIPEDDVAKIMAILSEQETNQVVARITDIFGMEWVIDPKAVQLMARNKINTNPVITSDFVDTPETLAAKKETYKDWSSNNVSIKPIKPTENRKVGQMQIEEALASVLKDMDFKQNPPLD
jgi:hypothetical protein